ncbi:MAG: zinc ribbon domain-containing protein [Gemmataceae bacterium]
MPLYEYVCQECEHPFEALVFGDEQAECPQCRGQKLTRQMSLPGRPQVNEGSSLPTACRSQGPPCGQACSRWNN